MDIFRPAAVRLLSWRAARPCAALPGVGGAAVMASARARASALLPEAVVSVAQAREADRLSRRWTDAGPRAGPRAGFEGGQQDVGHVLRREAGGEGEGAVQGDAV